MLSARGEPLVSTVAYDFLDGDGVVTMDSRSSSSSSGMLSDKKGEQADALEEEVEDLPENFILPGDNRNTFNGWSLTVVISGISNVDNDEDLDGEKGGVGGKDPSGDRGAGGTASERRLYPKPEGCISSDADLTVEARGNDVIRNKG